MIQGQVAIAQFRDRAERIISRLNEFPAAVLPGIEPGHRERVASDLAQRLGQIADEIRLSVEEDIRQLLERN